MTEPVKLSLKSLDARIDALDKGVANFTGELYARITALETQNATPPAPDTEYRDELMVAVINALYVQRSQGAYNMAKALEAKYFDGRNLQEIGDEFIVSSGLYSATKE